MNSFNSYGQTTKKYGGHTPVWLGMVKPIPAGAVLDVNAEEVTYPLMIAAGTPVIYVAEDRKFTAWDGTTGTPNGYLYNDIYLGEIKEGDAENGATGAIVMHHAEGLLIDNTEFGDIAATLATKIPGVLLVRTA